ncbi:MAG: hypothetical protein QHH17_06850 [Candidatus Bathyarchaeota archaeon]|nr:hypothetical protein [Candidatus Bathyarchaeota archaeon]
MDLLRECEGIKNIESPKQLVYSLHTSKAEVKKLLAFAEKNGLINDFRVTAKGIRVSNMWNEFRNAVFSEEKS